MSKLRWLVLTFGPAVLAVVVGVQRWLAGSGADGLWLVLFGLAFVGAGQAILSSYRTGYWRGRLEEGWSRGAGEDAGPYVERALTQQQPSPWDVVPPGRRAD